MRLRCIRSFDLKLIIFAFTGIFLMLLVAYPLSLVLLKTLSTEKGTSWNNYFNLAGDSLIRRAFLSTLYIGLAVTILATLFGMVTAWLITRTDLPFKRVFRNMILLTFITPAFMGAIAWIQLLGRSGYINNLLMKMFHLSAPPIRLYSMEGIIAIMAIHLYPIVFFIVANALRITDPSLEDAAIVSGSTRFKIITRITFPLILPSILSGAALVFIQTISCFGVAAVIGLPTGKYVLTTRIYAALAHYDVHMACTISVILMLISAFTLIVHNILLGRRRYTVTTTRSKIAEPIKLGRWRVPVIMVFSTILFVTILLPLGSILLSSLLKAWGLQFSLNNLTLGNYRTVLFKESLTARAIRNSVIFASTAATAAIFIGLLCSYIAIRSKRWGRRILDFLATMPLAIPGPVLATSMILAWIKPPLVLYNTPWIIIVSYIAAFIPYAVRSISGSLMGMDSSLEEIGWASGASWIRTVKDITIPLIKQGIWMGWILVFLMALREIPISTMLYTQGTETIGVILLSLGSETGGLETISALAAIVIGITITGWLIIERFGKTRMEIL